MPEEIRQLSARFPPIALALIVRCTPVLCSAVPCHGHLKDFAVPVAKAGPSAHEPHLAVFRAGLLWLPLRQAGTIPNHASDRADGLVQEQQESTLLLGRRRGTALADLRCPRMVRLCRPADSTLPVASISRAQMAILHARVLRLSRTCPIHALV
jgi:hypothetical protein